jgi:hypothetical protein
VPDGAAARAWLDAHRGGAAVAEALSVFDGLPPVATTDLVGRWRGRGLPTGSPLDGLLEAYGWWGKDIVGDDTVHPLLFADRRGRPRPLAPGVVPVAVLRRWPRVAHLEAVRRLGRAVRPLVTTSRPGARLRTVTSRGVATAALLYDALPVVDVFRRVDDGAVLGLMDLRGLEQPFFFVLERDA